MHTNKEIEVKLILEQQQLENLRAWVEGNALFMGIQDQIDYYFDLPAASSLYTNSAGFVDSDVCLRLRTIVGGPSFFTSKVKTFDPLTDRICNVDEYETEVVDGIALQRILQSVGYNIIATIEKQRTIYQAGPFEISFDEIKDMGSFVEIELKEDAFSNQEGLNKIYDFMRNRGIVSCRSFSRGYLTMLLNPGHDFSRELSQNCT